MFRYALRRFDVAGETCELAEIVSEGDATPLDVRQLMRSVALSRSFLGEARNL
jgi:hypothetical protein